MSVKSFKILIVCTGNTCRSPLGEGLLRQSLVSEGFQGVSVISAGTSAVPGMPPSKEAVEVAREFGVDISEHTSLPLSAALIERANLVLAMGEGHKECIYSLSPSSRGKVFLAGGFRRNAPPAEILDPIGGSVDLYRTCAQTLQESFQGLLHQLPILQSEFASDVVDFAVGTDHRGIPVKKILLSVLDRMNMTWEDMGAFSQEPSDYPNFAFAVGERVVQEKARRGALLCGTGIGMSIAANKIRGVRAAVVTNARLAQLSRTHNNTNVIVFCEDTTEAQLEELIGVWWNAEFEGGRHAKRVGLIVDYENLHSRDSQAGDWNA
ncbi:MAG TPA: RpiB/LacA/LacB family sugar-phosphate isomerase [bacterium]|nr:RpiB/LacA/LacB family sugar-phosphate isomerase [bacterium]